MRQKMGRIKKKEDAFYALFKNFVSDLLTCAEVYGDIICRWPESAQRVVEVQELEDACDKHTDECIELLATSFIVPFDREDINSIVFAMDDAVDLMEDVVARFDLFGVDTPLEEAKEMAQLTVKAAAKLQIVFDHLPSFMSDATSNKTAREKIREIRKIEDECDVVYRNGLARIFSDDHDYGSKVLLRWKSLFDSMEKVMDAIALVASYVRIVIIKNS